MAFFRFFQERALRSLHRRALTFLPRDSLQDCFLSTLEGQCWTIEGNSPTVVTKLYGAKLIACVSKE